MVASKIFRHFLTTFNNNLLPSEPTQRLISTLKSFVVMVHLILSLMNLKDSPG